MCAEDAVRLDRFGGWTGKQFKATGFFRVEKDDRWWLVTPEGNSFLSFGINHFHTGLWKQEFSRQAWRKRLGLENLNSPEFAPALAEPDASRESAGRAGFATWAPTLLARRPIFAQCAICTGARSAISTPPVQDDDGDVGSDSFVVTVNNVVPAATVLNDGSVHDRNSPPIMDDDVSKGIADTFDLREDAVAVATDQVLSQGNTVPLESLFWAEFAASNNPSSKPKKDKATDLALMMME